MSPAPVSPVTDQQLIARIVVSDDRHAFTELVRRHQSAVRSTLRKLAGGNAALADDLAQETFLLAYRNLKAFRQDAKFSTWLYRIAYNVFLGDARKIKELPMPEDMDVDALSPAPDLAEKEKPPRQAALGIDPERAMRRLPEAGKAASAQGDPTDS